MVRTKIFGVALLVAFSGWTCSDFAQEARTLVDEADAKLVSGGLEYPTVRADMQALYDEALRKADASDLPASELAYIESHAHFGLAMNRIWDLADRVLSILEEGGVLAALRGEGLEAGSEQPEYCELFDDFAALESIIRLLLDTALDPIVEDLRAAVAADPSFSITILQGRYDLESLTTERALESYLDFAATYSTSDVRFLLAGAELLSGTARGLFAYRDLLANMLLFSFAGNSPIGGYASKVFNSNPCVDYPSDGNPFLRPEFATLHQDGAGALKEAQVLIGAGVENLGVALQEAIGKDAASHLIGAESSDGAWGTGLVYVDEAQDSPRLQLQLKAGSESPLVGAVQLYELLATFLTGVTPQIPVDNASLFFADLAAAIKGGGAWDMDTQLRKIIPNGDIGQVAQVLVPSTSGIPDLDDFETVFVQFDAVFNSPPGDLKQFVPLMYREDEPFTDANGDGRRNIENAAVLVRSEEDFVSTEPFTDINCNGRWDQRGDLVIHHEFEPFIDENENGKRDSSETRQIAGAFPETLGIVGAFIDLDADGTPDRPKVDGVAEVDPVAGSQLCGSTAPVTWPAAVGDDAYGEYPLKLSDPTTDAPYGVPKTDPTRLNEKPYEDGEVLGPVIGHYWPTNVWIFGSWPKEARRDAANGVRDTSYLFFPDPTFGGIVQRDRGGEPDPSGTTNGWLNRFLAQWSALAGDLGL